MTTRKKLAAYIYGYLLGCFIFCLLFCLYNWFDGVNFDDGWLFTLVMSFLFCLSFSAVPALFGLVLYTAQRHFTVSRKILNVVLAFLLAAFFLLISNNFKIDELLRNDLTIFVFLGTGVICATILFFHWLFFDFKKIHLSKQ